MKLQTIACQCFAQATCKFDPLFVAYVFSTTGPSSQQYAYTCHFIYVFNSGEMVLFVFCLIIYLQIILATMNNNNSCSSCKNNSLFLYEESSSFTREIRQQKWKETAHESAGPFPRLSAVYPFGLAASELK